MESWNFETRVERAMIAFLRTHASLAKCDFRVGQEVEQKDSSIVVVVERMDDVSERTSGVFNMQATIDVKVRQVEGRDSIGAMHVICNAIDEMMLRDDVDVELTSLGDNIHVYRGIKGGNLSRTPAQSYHSAEFIYDFAAMPSSFAQGQQTMR